MAVKGKNDLNSKLELARRIILANPAVTANRTLAKLLLHEYPMLFKDIEGARMAIRHVQGLTGKKFRSESRESVSVFVNHLTKLRNEYKINDGLKVDTSPYVISSEFKKIGVISDFHIPYADLDAINIALEYFYNQGVDAVVINGDALDFNSISRFLSRPTEMRMLDSVSEGKKMLQYVSSALGCKLILHEGNHDCRVEHYLLSKAPEFWGLASVELKNLLGCEELNVGYVKDIRTMHYGRLTIAHGHHIVKGVFAPVNPARGAFIKANDNIMISHVHRTSSHIESNINGKITGAWSIGCMTNIKPEYNPMVSRHNQGFAVVELTSDEGDFIVDNRMIIDYKLR